MKKRIISIVYLVIVSLVVLLIMAGCSKNTEVSTNMTNVDVSTESTVCDNEKETLRIVVEPMGFFYPRMESLLNKVILNYERENKNVDIIVERLPESKDDQLIVIKRLRAELMAGRGPDVLLLHTNPTTINCERLIADVNQAMRNGIFTDISVLYGADADLNKEELNTKIMDSGVVDGARYVLPLRYNIPIAYVDMDQLDAAGLSMDTLNADITELMEVVSQQEDVNLATSASFQKIYSKYMLNLLPDSVNYDEQEVLITSDELVSFMNSFAKFNSVRGNHRGPNNTALEAYVLPSDYGWDPYWATSGYCMDIDDLGKAIHNVGLAHATETKLEMIPLRSADGSLVADVVYYGAVASGCENVELAYDFLRQFLLQDYQWELLTDLRATPQSILAGEGWPVRIVGSVPYLARALNSQLGSHNKENLQLQQMTDADVPLLQMEIDKVQYSIELEKELGRLMWNYLQRKDANVDQFAKDWLQDLEWHVGEG